MPTHKLKTLLLALWLACGPLAAETPTPKPALVAEKQAPSRPADRPVLAWNFDWDDNIMFMKTKVILYKKGTDEEKAVSTGEWAEVRQQVGKPGEWENYEVRDVKGGSFRYFADARGKNYFLDDILESMGDASWKWKGPSWEAFVEACSRPETAARVTIITARGHSPNKMHLALKELQRRGILKFVPPKKNLYAVGAAADPSGQKTVHMMDILDGIQRETVKGNFSVVDQDGTGEARLHLWGFSDDDFGNFEAARNNLSEAIKKDPKRWSRIKITLFYTGTKKEGVSPHAVVLTSKGDVRDLQARELDECKRILGDRGCDVYYDWLTKMGKGAKK